MTEADLEVVFKQSGIREMAAQIARLDAAMAELLAEANRTEAEIKDLGNTSNKAGDQMGGMGKAVSGLGGLLASAGLAFGAAEVLNLGKSAIQSAINYETLSVQFEVFLGSAEKAKKVLADLNKFSIETPFTPDQVNASGRALLAFGFTTEQLIPTLKMVGDVSAAVGKDLNELAVIYGKARTAGTLYAEDINQLTEAGIPIMDELAKVLGVQADQVKKLGSEGKISFGTLEKAFANMTGEGGRFNGMMDKMSLSTAGLLSTIEGKLQDELRAIGQAMLPTIRVIAEGFEPAFKSLKDAFIEIYTPLADTLSVFGDLLSVFNFGGKEGNKFANIVGLIAKVLKVITLPAQLFWKIVGAIAGAFTWAVKGIKEFIQNSPFLLDVINVLTFPMRTLGDAISWVGDALGLTSDAAFDAAKGFNQFDLFTNEMRARLGATTEQLQAFKDQFDLASIAGMSTGDAMKSVVQQFKAFLAASTAAKGGADAFGKSLKDMSKEAVFASGSIAATEAQMKKLQEAFKLTGSEFDRTQIAKKIADLQLVLDRMKNGADLSVLTPKAVTDITDFAKAAQNAQIALDSLGGGNDGFVDQLSKKQQALVDFKVAMHEVGAVIKNDLGGAFKQFGQDLAENLGKAIGMGGSLGDVFKKAIAEMLVQIPKLAGMALLNAAAFPANAPIALPLAAAGLALLGLSGIIGGIQQKNANEREAAANMAGLAGTPSGASGGQSGPMGLGESSGMVIDISLNLDGSQVARLLYDPLKKEKLKRG